MISDKYKCIFVGVPKVASSAIGSIDEFEWVGTPYEYIYPKKSPLYYKFTFVRNPWSRLVSCYNEKVVSPVKWDSRFGIYKGFLNHYGREGNGIKFSDMTFENFVDFVITVPDDKCERHFRPQTSIFSDIPYSFDRIGKIENIKVDFKQVCTDIAAENILLPVKNKSKSIDYREFYTNSLKEKIHDKYLNDIEKFEYTFE